MPNLNILENVNKYVTEEISKGNIPSDAKLALVGTLDNKGFKIAAAVKIANTEKLKVSVSSIFDHEWDGDNTFGTFVTLYVK